MTDRDFKEQLEYAEREKHLQSGTSHGGMSDPYTYVDPNDGMEYEWNATKQAWFPKISDDFMAAYQANYGQPSDTEQSSTAEVPVTTDENVDEATNQSKAEQQGQKRKANESQGWFEVDDQHNTTVYVSNLPLDTTDEEFIELMSKCGIIMKDSDNAKLKIKLYRDETGELKGDGRCTYIKVESVNLALSILDGYQFKGKEVRVERAHFQLKGVYDPTKKPRKKKPKDKKKIKQLQEKLLDWRPDRLRGERMKCEKTVIVKNMFDPKEFEEDATMILEYQRDLREECSKFGEVKRVTVYDRHPDGVAAISFAEAEMADACLEALNGRWFAQRRLTAESWDGRTKYTVVESEAEKEARRKEWEKYLDQDEKPTAGAGGGAGKGEAEMATTVK